MSTKADGDVAGTSSTSDLPVTDVPTAVKELWYIWILALVSAIAAVYFATTDDVVSTPAEQFYAIIFGALTVVAVAYGAYRVHERTTLF